MPNTWLMVADTSQAKFFSVDTKGLLNELEILEHPEGRLHVSELTSDLPGRAFDSAGNGGRHAMETKISPKEQEAIGFAKQIGTQLESHREKGEFEKLIVIAPPAFLGLLRKKMGPNITRTITKEIGKNLVGQTNQEIQKHLPEKI